eukprot:5189370-Pleurochrysis_carterae.AAC.2
MTLERFSYQHHTALCTESDLSCSIQAEALEAVLQNVTEQPLQGRARSESVARTNSLSTHA